MSKFSFEKILSTINIAKIKKTKIKKILIVGGGGFIGTYLTNTLLSKKLKNNFQVYIIDINPPILMDGLVKKNNFFFIKKNLFKINNFNIKKKFDLIIHLAGIPSPTLYKKKPLETFNLNLQLTEKLLKFAKINKSKFIYFSSSEIYGNPDDKNIPTKENYQGRVSSVSDRSCYDESKRGGETLTYIYKNIFNMDNKIIRPFNFYGCGMRKNDGRIIPRFFQTALYENKIYVFNHGKQTRTYCNIIDAIPIIIYICFFGKSFVYNVGNNKEETSANKVALKIKKIINNKKIRIYKINYPNNYPSDEPQRRCPNIDKIKREFRYRPKINLNKGLKLFYSNLINNKFPK